MKIAALIVLAGAAVANADVFSGAGFSIPDNNAGGASSSVNVAGVGNGITGITVTLHGFSHTWLGDVTATLSGPAGSFVLFDRPGNPASVNGNSNDTSGDYLFTDAAPGVFSTSGAVPAGSYRTSSDDVAPTSLMGFFGGTSADGMWTLTMTDSAGLDVGGITGWSLDVVPTPGAAAMLGLGGLAALRRRR
ncbi:MAG TPA: hypothetical protein VFF65_00085 [Phycisphaerales bacterium]|nr:hypothetical protein [Phycisphaerales bacterium]